MQRMKMHFMGNIFKILHSICSKSDFNVSSEYFYDESIGESIGGMLKG